MAEENKIQQFTGGLNKDLVNYQVNATSWTHAKNLTIQSNLGDLTTLVTEMANKLCVTLPYDLIGAIPLDGAQWAVFCTDNVNSEIGIVDTDNCTYTKFSNTPCLNFNKASLITGAARRNFECGFNVYWSDGGRNPDRYINTNPDDLSGSIWVQNCVTTSTCTTCTNTDQLDCDKIRIAPLMDIPCITLAKSNTAGTLLNGTYQIALAYAVNGIKCTNYIVLSKPQSLFSHTNEAGALTLNVTGADNVHFKEMILTVVSFINGQLVARKLGVWDTDQTSVTISSIDQTLPYEDLSLIPLQVPAIEKSDSIWSVNNLLLRNGIYERPSFNYQPLANLIQSEWVLMEKPEQYYQKAGDELGMEIGYLRDEVYCFFIRWVYNTGDKSASYHIPGRAYNPAIDGPWRTQNTAGITSLVGGARGYMSYWESTERYPSQQASVWGSLCGQPIRHHKFPDQTVDPSVLTHFTNNRTIKILGVKFNNIQTPVDDLGLPITNIVGYEILRGSREGNKSIIAKGMINNMRMAVSDVPNSTAVLYQNYPYNDLNPDLFLTTSQTIGTVGGNIDGYQGNQQSLYRQEVFSFHSPDTTFANPFIGTGHLRVYQTLLGESRGHFEIPYKHPKFKVITKLVSSLATAIGLIDALGGLAQAAGGVNFKFAATDELPFDIPLGLAIASPDGPVGTIGTIAYGLQVAYNISVLAAISVIKLKAIQQQMINAVTGLIPKHQYARQYNSVGFYNDFHTLYAPAPNINVNFNNYQYVKGQIQTFEGLDLNNLYRNDYVIFNLTGAIPDPFIIPGQKEVSRWTQSQRFCALGDDSCQYREIIGCPTLTGYGGLGTPPFASPNLCSHYVGVKVSFPSQYGQIGSVREVPITSCIYPTTPGLVYSTPTLFGGDTYINRYTEKNPFLFFNDWLVDVPDDFQYDYTMYENIPYPRYWINNTHVYYDFWSSADKNYHVDENNVGPLDFWVKEGFFYLFYNGVRDFYVESDVNVGFRDWEEQHSKRFYDPYGYTNIEYMFRSDLIKSNVFYKYDYSLSVNKFYSQYVSFGQVLPRDYDPLLAYTCYNYYPRRVAYSLPQTEELKLDNWRQFLPNNYADFYTQVTAIKSISKTGALFLMKEQSPVEFTGTQILQQGEPGKVAITVGDGGLFNQPLQNVSNTEKGINYGSCKSRLSSLNTPYGLVWVSQQAGEVFLYTGKVEEISNAGMKYWFSRYLPSQLLQQFPTYPYPDNPVIGVGVQVSFDETNDILYVSKKDYRVRDQYVGIVEMANSGEFYYNDTNLEQSIPIKFTNTTYFEDCSWTVSFSFISKFWISFHSWFPTLSLSARRNVVTNKTNTLWTHNNRTNKFSNFYGIDYPYEIEYQSNTTPSNTTLKNIEYRFEGFYYQPNGKDRMPSLCYNWDKLIISNEEQISGVLNMFPKSSNPYTNLTYPIIGPNSISILYSCKEAIIRANDFYDILNNRQAPTNIWISSWNGVDKTINPLAVNYNKPTLQTKKFRGYNNTIFLQKLVADNIQGQIRLNHANHQNSPR